MEERHVIGRFIAADQQIRRDEIDVARIFASDRSETVDPDHAVGQNRPAGDGIVAAVADAQETAVRRKPERGGVTFRPTAFRKQGKGGAVKQLSGLIAQNGKRAVELIDQLVGDDD